MQCDILRASDVGRALELSAANGWNQTEADWHRLITLEPSGCFAARLGNRLIGTVTAITYGLSLAWIGMMIVHPDFRRQGVGSALMRLALEYLHKLKVTAVKLDATPAGRPLYESLGFVAETEFERWQGVAKNCGATTIPFDRDTETLRHVIALDQAAYAADRSRLLRQLVADCAFEPLVVNLNRGTPDGYALARSGLEAIYIGPVVGNTSQASRKLLEGMLQQFQGEEICLDLHTGKLEESSLLAQRGLTRQRCLTRMRLGVENHAVNSQSVCASAGPELG